MKKRYYLFVLLNIVFVTSLISKDIEDIPLTWMSQAKLQMSESAWGKIPAIIRPLIDAPPEFLEMQSKILEIHQPTSAEPVLGILVKYRGNRNDLEGMGLQVGSQLGDIFTLKIPINRLSDLAGNPDIVSIEPSVIHKLHLDSSIVDCKADLVQQGDYGNQIPEYYGYAGEGVLVATLDSGIDWEHEDFIRDSDGASRILYIWDQTLIAQNNEKPPDCYNYGVEYTRAEINDEIDGTPAGFVRSIDEIGHGTHVMGIITGDGSSSGNNLPAYTYIGIAPRSEMIVIKSTLYTSDLIDGVNYAIEKAEELGRPIVINMSFGSQFGAHDGTSLEEQAYNNTIGSGKVIVVSAGNEGTDADHGEYIHAEGTVTTGTTDSITFVIPDYIPYSGAGNDLMFIDLWYQGQDYVNIEVISPNGYSYSRSTGFSARGLDTYDGAFIIDNASYGRNSNNQDHECIILIFDYRYYRKPAEGTWTIVVTGNTINESGHYDAWIAVNQLGSEEAYFSAASGSNKETIGIPGTAEKIITVAAHSTKNSWISYNGTVQSLEGNVVNDIAYFSSVGPTRDDPGYIEGMRKPDISAPGFGVISALSTDAEHFYTDPEYQIYRNQDGNHVMMTGTSMSAPHVTGAVALIFDKNKTLNAAEIKQIITNSAATDSYTGSVPNYRWGYGKLDAYNAVQDESSNPDYFVNLTPSSQIRSGAEGRTISCPVRIRNIGVLQDSYDLSITGNTWVTTLWDSNGTSQINTTEAIPAGSNFKILVKVDIPVNSIYGDADSVNLMATSQSNQSVSDYAKITTESLGAAANLPWIDTFPSTSLNSTKWLKNVGSASVNSTGLTEPSPSYSLNLDGLYSGGDEVCSQAFDLSGYQEVVFSYYYQRTGGGDSPEEGDDLWVDYYNSEGKWINIKRYFGSGEDMSSYALENIYLPSDAYHNSFRIRFKSSGYPDSDDADDWFIDDVSVCIPPEINVYPDEIAATLDLGDSTTQILTIGNIGEGALNFKIAVQYNTTNSSSQTEQLITSTTSSKIDEVKHAELLNRIKSLKHDVDSNSPLNNLKLAGIENPDHPDGITPDFIQQNPLLEAGPISNPTLSSASIYWDYYHSENHTNFDLIITELQNAGHSITTKDELITSDALNGYDILVLEPSRKYSLSVSEIGAIQGFIDSGHGLFCIGEAEGYLGTTQTNSLNDLLSPYGMSMSGSYNSGLDTPVDNFADHPLTQGVNVAEFTYFSNISVTSPGIDLASTNTGIVVLAVYEASGKIVFVSDCHPFSDNNLYTYDDLLLALNIVDWLSSEGIRQWLTVSPTSGSVEVGNSRDIDLKFNTKTLVSGETYQALLKINSNDPENYLVEVPVQLNVNPTPYYFTLSPSNQSETKSPGDTVFYKFTIKNNGDNADTYDINVTGNDWPTTIWDADGLNQLTSVGPVPSRTSVDIIVHVEIPENAVDTDIDMAEIAITSSSDVNVSNVAVITTKVFLPVPWFDNFLTTELDPIKWPFNQTAYINSSGSNEPSPPYSLNLDAVDEIRSQVLNLKRWSKVVLSYHYEKQGSASLPEDGNDLYVEYNNSAGEWVFLNQHLGGGTGMSSYDSIGIILPVDAYHANFSFRFRTTGDDYSDDWFIDNVNIFAAPEITVTPNNISTTLNIGDSINQTLTIGNIGKGDLNFRIIKGSNSSPQSSSLNLIQNLRSYPDSYYTHGLNKDDIDPRKGAAVLLGLGGPDNHGYTWIDSDEPGGPVFQWEDISSIGIQITGLGLDSNVGPFPIGFTLKFYGNSFTSFRFCSNGFISFTSTATDFSNEPIPNDQVYNLIAPFWDDLNFNAGGQAYYYSDGEKLIIQYNDVPHYSSGGPYTFEIILYSNGNIKFQYLSMVSRTEEATIGIQNNDGTDGLEIAFNATYVHDNLAILISTGESIDWLTFFPASGFVEPFNSQDIDIKFDATELTPDSTYYANLKIFSNDPVNSVKEIPVQLTVNRPPYSVSVSPSEQFMTGFPGDTVFYRITIHNEGQNDDTYDLSISGNNWQTTIWDTSESNQLTSVGPVPSRSSKDISVRVMILEHAKSSDVDSAAIVVTSSGDLDVFNTATIVTKVYIPIPWIDYFSVTTLDTMRWAYNQTALINDSGLNEPSPPSSLNLDGSDEVRSRVLDLTMWSDIVLSYHYEKKGDEDAPEVGDDLYTEYYNSEGAWVILRQHLGDGMGMVMYDSIGIRLPPDAYHNNFSFRFRTTGNLGTDDWFIDNVGMEVILPSSISVSHDSIKAVLNLGDSTTQKLTITNSGEGDLYFDILIQNTRSASNSMIERAKASMIERSGILSHKIKNSNVSPETGGNVEAVYSLPEDIVNVRYINQLPQSSDLLSVAIVASASSSGANSPYFTDVRDKLLSTGKFSSVTIIDAHIITPTISELQAFDAVLVWSNTTYLNQVDLGNNLADYVDSGGGVVLAVYETASPLSDYYLGGRWESEKYYVFERSFIITGRALLGTINDPHHPIMNGVTSLDGGSWSTRPSSTNLTAGSDLIASWSDGMPLVAVKEINGTNRVDLGLYPPSSNVLSYSWVSTTDGATLMANSLIYAATTSAENWLVCTPNSGRVLKDSSLIIDVKIRAVYLKPDSIYCKTISIRSNDPEKSNIYIPVKIKVESIVGIEENNLTSIPREFSLGQNYPNPFNPTTHIRFGLPKACYVKIELYNIIGQKIYTLFECNKNAGYHTIEFNGSNLASGLYFYKMQSSNFNKVKKMLLVK